MGASGSGTTTLGSFLSERLGAHHIDSDAIYWLPSDPPFQHRRDSGERLRLLRQVLNEHPAWVISGSLCGWGDPVIPHFDLVVFLTLDRDVRMTRLRAREHERYGMDAVRIGSSRYEGSRAFLEWAERYDDAGLEQRSRVLHEAWLVGLPCPVLRLNSEAAVADLAAAVAAQADGGAVGAYPFGGLNG